MLEKANMLLLTNETTHNDRSLKHDFSWQQIHTKNAKIRGEPVWKKFGYFGHEKTDFNIENKDFSENALCYVNQVYSPTV